MFVDTQDIHLLEQLVGFVSNFDLHNDFGDSVSELLERARNTPAEAQVNKINNIIELASQLPSGLNDAQAAEKLVRERDELHEVIEEGDRVGALTEAADAGYYAAKHLQYVASLLDLTIGQVLDLTIAKYELRARPGNPKSDSEEREACAKTIAPYNLPVGFKVARVFDYDTTNSKYDAYLPGEFVVVPDYLGDEVSVLGCREGNMVSLYNEDANGRFGVGQGGDTPQEAIKEFNENR